jgi:hypothetical protein
MARSGRDWLLFDAGPIAHGLHADGTPSVAHGHADPLQVLYFSQGRPILRDSGMPFYGARSAWTDYFRGPAAHNTIEVEGAPAVRFAGSLAWSHVAGRPQLDAHLSGDVWLACGRAEWPTGVRVERHVLGLPNEGLWVADWICLAHSRQARRPRRVCWYWQLSAHALTDVRSSGAARLVAGDGLTLATWCDGELEVVLEDPDQTGPAAWEAVEYGIFRPAQRLRCETRASGGVAVVTFIGRSPVAAEVTLHGRRLICSDASDHRGNTHGNGSSQRNDGLTPADILWRIQSSGGWREFSLPR